MLSPYGTEQVGISTEIAIANLSNVPVDASYMLRGRQILVDHISPVVQPLLTQIPKVVQHIAEDRNPIDFLLEGGKTLSVKSNMRLMGKVAPQNVGQATSKTLWSRLPPELVPPGLDISNLSYAELAKSFKQVAQKNTVEMLTLYWNNLFDCDYLIYLSEVLDKSNKLTVQPVAVLFNKVKPPKWKEGILTFTRTLDNWNESCTVKYNNISIGEWQIHNNRDTFKFRFNLRGIIKAGLL